MSHDTKIKACRACCDTLCSKFIEFSNRNVLEQYEYCTGLKVEPEDTPYQICISCYEKLTMFTKFKIRCHKSESFWKSVLSEDTKSYTKYEIPIKDEIEESLLDNNTPERYCNSVEEIGSLSDKKISDTTGINKIPDNRSDSNQVKSKRKNLDYAFKDNVLEKKEKKKKKEEKLTERPIGAYLNYCGLCDMSSEDQDVVDTHVAVHFARGELNCQLCDYKGRDLADMATHRFSHYPPESVVRYRCHACKCRSGTFYALQFHYRSVHLKTEGGWCRHCDKRFITRKGWKVHELTHKLAKAVQDVKGFECDVCGKHFLYRNSIIQHLNEHANIREFICDSCGKAFKRMSALKLHKMCYHAKLTPVVCTHCNKKYKSEYHLKVHMRQMKMLNSSGVYCPVCSKRFVSGKALKKHMVWHSEARPYKCKKCDGAFKVKGQLNAHNTIVHATDKPFKCESCEARFPTRRQLQRHFSVHTGIRPHKCPYCEISCYNRKQVRLHCISRHSKLPPPQF